MCLSREKVKPERGKGKTKSAFRLENWAAWAARRHVDGRVRQT